MQGPVGPPVGDSVRWAAPGAPGGPVTPPSGPPGFQPPPGGDGSGGGRSRLGVGLAVFAVMALIISLIGYAVIGGDDDGGTETERADSTTTAPAESSTTTTSDTDESTTTTAPAAQIDEAELLAVVAELQDYVEAARGLEFSRDVVVEVVDDQTFENRLLDDFEEDVEDFEQAEVFYRALALLDSDEPLAEQLRSFYAQGVLGFYDTETDELVVRGTELNGYVRSVIVHELVHAIDDQNFELFRPDYDELDNEVPLAFSAVVEGNAKRVESDWIADQPASVQDEIEDIESEFAEGIDLDDVAYAILFEIGAPYQFGEIFVDGIVGDQGERAVDEALTTPPETSEQIMFPEVYDERQPAVEVETPAADGDVVDEGVIGALVLFGLLTDPDSGIDPVTATRAVEGWGGDRYVTWTDGDANCVRADFVGDSEADTEELSDALQEWTELRGVGVVSDVDGMVRLESCTVFTGGAESQA